MLLFFVAIQHIAQKGQPNVFYELDQNPLTQALDQYGHPFEPC